MLTNAVHCSRVCVHKRMGGHLAGRMHREACTQYSELPVLVKSPFSFQLIFLISGSASQRTCTSGAPHKHMELHYLLAAETQGLAPVGRIPCKRLRLQESLQTELRQAGAGSQQEGAAAGCLHCLCCNPATPCGSG